MSKPPAPGPDDRGFLSRWSQRKVQGRAGTAPQPDAAPLAPLAPVAPAARPAGSAVVAPAGTGAGSVPDAAPPAPTLDDVAALTADADFTPFVQPGVDAPVRNAALRKLFADPHYNVMDGLDTYIDDYGRPDPLPVSMLRRMTQAGVLGLFTEEAGPSAPDPAETTTIADRAPADEDPDLRLQPDDAAAGQGAEPGPDPDPGRQR